MNRTDKEQALLFEGKDHWHLNCEAEITFSDGPNGLRIEDQKGLGFTHSKEATVFPTASCIGNSFDPAMIQKYGSALAEECISEGVNVILGPGVTGKRSPLCGRNFEYFSEDPVLSGNYAAAYIQGVQKKGIATSLKHYAGNSCELGRQVQNSLIDERTLHEVYLRQFEIAVRNGHPWTMMPAYNQLNGIYCCENKQLMDEARSWGFDGVFVSDWGGVSDPLASIQNGLNVEMPGKTGSHRIIEKALEQGTLTRDVLQKSTDHIEKLIERCTIKSRDGYVQEVHDQICEKAAEESIVLLKNEGVLPLQKDETVTIIGPFAKQPKIQGSGSSCVNSIDHDSLLQALDQSDQSYHYEEGYRLDTDEIDEQLRDQAVSAAEHSSRVIILVGLPEENSGEGFDRTSMDLPFNQNTLIRDLAKINSHVIVVLQTGAPVTMPWRQQVSGIVAEYLAGARSGAALKKILYGDVNPSGHLAETWPIRLEDNPSYRYYDQSVFQSQYREAIYTGYRYYDTFNIPTAYCFGHGLSYTQFAYSSLHIEKMAEDIKVSVNVKNTGDAEGRAVIQLYVGMHDSKIARPKKELKSFASVKLRPDEERTVTMVLHPDAFTYWDIQRHGWRVEQGTYQIMIGRDVSDIVLQSDIEMDGCQDPYSVIDPKMIQFENGSLSVSEEAFAELLGCTPVLQRPVRPFNQNTTVTELKACGLGRTVNFFIERFMALKHLGGTNDHFVYDAPIRQMLWVSDAVTWDTVHAAADYLNHHGMKEMRKLLHSIGKE